MQSATYNLLLQWQDYLQQVTFDNLTEDAFVDIKATLSSLITNNLWLIPNAGLVPFVPMIVDEQTYGDKLNLIRRVMEAHDLGFLEAEVNGLQSKYFRNTYEDGIYEAVMFSVHNDNGIRWYVVRFNQAAGTFSVVCYPDRCSAKRSYNSFY